MSEEKCRIVNRLKTVFSFEEFIATPFSGDLNAICYARELKGNFEELMNKIDSKSNLLPIEPEDLQMLELSPSADEARQVILQDIMRFKELGHDPVLNLISYYHEDESVAFFPTDVYSFHVDRSPIPSATFLCTYVGDTSELVFNENALQKITIPEYREQLRGIFEGREEDFEDFLIENFFDLHYLAKEGVPIVKQEQGSIWKLAVDYPNSPVLPSIHRAPREISGKKRLLLIC